MLTVALFMIVVAAGAGVCAWVDALDRIWLVAGAGAAMVALLAAFQAIPQTSFATGEQDFRTWFIATFLVGITLNGPAAPVGRTIRRRRSRGDAPRQK